MNIGDEASMSKTITGEDIQLCANLTGDTNPLHLDDGFARMTRFGRRIAHGVLALGLISAVLGNRLPGPGTIYLSQEVKFLLPVYIDDTITAKVRVSGIQRDKKIVTFETNCFNQKGQTIVSGKAIVLYEDLS